MRITTGNDEVTGEKKALVENFGITPAMDAVKKHLRCDFPASDYRFAKSPQAKIA
jgi:hypothetical protein